VFLIDIRYFHLADEDDDEDLGLFSSLSDAKTIDDPAGSPIPGSEVALGQQKSLSRRKSNDVVRRRILRSLAFDEIPLIVYHNWRFYKPLAHRRRGSVSTTGKNMLSVQPTTATNQRELSFYVKQIEVSDSEGGLLTTNSQGVTLTSTEKSASTVTILQTQLRSLSLEKLQRRLTLLNKEETRAIDEVTERYSQQIAWVRQMLQNRM
jgi:hypothetical protein